MRACLTLLSSCLLNYFSNSDPATEKDEMSSPPADDAPVRSERPKLNLKPRDEGAAAKLATERAVAAKSVSEVFACEWAIRESLSRRRRCKASTLAFWRLLPRFER
jgi:hypothetical protein